MPGYSSKRAIPFFKVAVPIVTIIATIATVELLSWIALSVIGPPAKTVTFDSEDVWPHQNNPEHLKDPYLLWRPKPDFQGMAYGHPLSINAHGLRGPEQSKSKNPDTYRVLLLGDSVTFGFGLANEDTYATKLNTWLNNNISKLSEGRWTQSEVLNAGVVGYTSFQGSRRFSRDLQSFSPDLVVAMFGYNDHHSAEYSDADKAGVKSVSNWADWVANSSVYKLFSRLKTSEIPGLAEQPLPRVSPKEFVTNMRNIASVSKEISSDSLFLVEPVRNTVPLVSNFRLVDNESGYSWVRQIDIVGRALGKDSRFVIGHVFRNEPLTKFCAAEGRKDELLRLSSEFPRLPIFPYLQAKCCVSDCSQLESAWRKLDTDRSLIDEYQRSLVELGKEISVPVVDLRDDFMEKHSQLFLDDVHPNAEGAGLIANAIAKAIIELSDDWKN